ncbi:UNVERIFIED_CONTAM: hypothetical protein RMT77_003884 [Armadillidium vulgare]
MNPKIFPRIFVLVSCIFAGFLYCALSVSAKPNGKKFVRPPKCNLPLDGGSCLANRSAYGFNVKTGRCERFSWGGCPANANLFHSIEECFKQCGGIPPKKIES